MVGELLLSMRKTNSTHFRFQRNLGFDWEQWIENMSLYMSKYTDKTCYESVLFPWEKGRKKKEIAFPEAFISAAWVGGGEGREGEGDKKRKPQEKSQ